MKDPHMDNVLAKAVIHMIAEGSTDGDSRRARQAYVRAVRTVMEIDKQVLTGESKIQFGFADAQGYTHLTMTLLSSRLP